jgi:hypothetical protein
MGVLTALGVYVDLRETVPVNLGDPTHAAAVAG